MHAKKSGRTRRSRVSLRLPQLDVPIQIAVLAGALLFGVVHPPLAVALGALLVALLVLVLVGDALVFRSRCPRRCRRAVDQSELDTRSGRSHYRAMHEPCEHVQEAQ